MRPITSIRLLLAPALLLAAGCEESSSPFEPPTVAAPAQRVEAPALAAQRWADAYLRTYDPALAGYTPPSFESYNRGGGSMKVVALREPPDVMS